MIRQHDSRREFLKRAAASAAVAAFPVPAIAQQAGGQVVVIGGGFAGATCARTLKRLDPRHTVTLVEASPTFTACHVRPAILSSPAYATSRPSSSATTR
jgi:heterodisulfide reductase subunit A-like polyferredoxin